MLLVLLPLAPRLAILWFKLYKSQKERFVLKVLKDRSNHGYIKLQ